MVKIIDGKNATLGRLASYVSKECLKGEEIIILNCDKIIITGNKKNIKENFEKKRKWVGSTQKGPKISRISEKIVKKVIRGMLPNYRNGRGRDAFKKLRCYNNVPKEFEEKEKIISGKIKTTKFIEVKELSK